MSRTEFLIIRTLVYDLGGLLVILGIAVGSGINQAPLWQALIAPLVYGPCLAVITHENEPSAVTRRVVVLVVLGFIVAIAGYYLGPELVEGY